MKKKANEKQSIKRTNPADAANIFTRNLLCDISEIMGGFSDKNLKKTLKYFDNRCVYTGCKLTSKTLTIDHLIPHNRTSCGLHLYGNIVPASSLANKQKGAKDFEVFIRSLKHEASEILEARIEKLKKFQIESGYLDKIQLIPDLQKIVQEKYQKIIDLTNEAIEEIEASSIDDAVKAKLEDYNQEQQKELEIDKVKRRVPQWLNKPDQANTRILTSYLKLLNGKDHVTIANLENTCSAVVGFRSNLSNMSKISPNNHGKVFEVIEDKVYLWGPVKEFLVNLDK